MGEPFNWLFKEERLRRTPSIKIGISHGQELFFRQKQAMLMQTIGQKSGLTPLAINTSVIFMHRFYMYRTIKFFPRIHVAIGFVFAAGKVEESARKLEHLIRFTVDVLRNNKNGEFLDKRDKLTYEMDCEWREKIETLCQNNCDVSSVAYEEMRKTVLECETEIYAVIGFQLQITHPHKFVIRMSSQLGAENRPAIYRAIKDAEKQISGSRRCVDGSGVSPPSNTNGNGLNGHSNPSGTDDLQAVSKKTSQIGNGKTNGHNNADRQNGNGEHLKGINGNSMQIDSQNRPNGTHSTDDSSNDSTGVPRMEIATTHIAGSVYIADNIKDISQYAYNLATVSTQLTLLNLKYKPETIATVCLNIASKAHSVKFMSNKDTNKYWYRVCDPAAEFKEIEAVSEEFLALIKACPLLPSWMTNLSRGPTRAVARQPGHPHRPVAPSGNHHPPSSSRQPPPRPPTSQPAAATSSSDTTSSGSHSQQPASSTTTSSSSSSIPHSEAGSATSTSSSSHPAVPSSTSSSSHHSQHHPDSNRQQQQQLAPSGASSSANRPPSSTVPGASGSSSSSGSNRHHPQHQHHHQQQQLHHQRSHPSAPPSSRGGHHKSQQPPVPGSRPQQPPSSSSSSRPQPPSTGHAAPPNPSSSSSSSLQYPPRPDYPRRPEGTAPQERRPPSQYPIEDVNRHHSQQQRQQQPSVNQNLSSHLTEIPRSTPPVPQAQQPPPQQQQTSMVSNPTTPPEPYPGSLANDTPDFLASPSDSNHGSQSLSAAAAAAAGVGPKLSLSSYRERLGTRIRPGQSSSSQNDSLNTDDSGIHTAASEENCSSLDTNTLSVDSPNNSNVSTPDLGSSFSVPQDSPTNPRLKLKVKRESSLAAGAAGPSAIPGDKQQHNVKYADSGLRIKIKPPKMELLKDEELSGGASRSGTPVEEGEVFDSPSSTGSSDRRSDGSLKMRLTIPKRGETEMNGSGDGVDQSSSGGHRHHHSGHHHRKHHHHHKSKKHKQSSSRHEGKSSKRSGDHNEERPSKASRMDHDSQSSTSTSVYRGPVPMHNQNSGFSINDAFSSTMPNNIFDDEDDSSQSTAPPITPTPDSVPSHHHHRMYRQSSSSRKPPSSSSSLPSMNSMLEDPPHHHHFHQLMAQHRANEAKKPPLPPLPASNQPPPPPPPPPPRSPPPSAF